MKSLPFRMVVPIVLVTALVGAGLYFFVLRSVSEFTDRQIREALANTSRDLYDVCDAHFTTLMKSGRMGNDAAARIQRARALGEIEDFVKRNRVGCLLVDSGTGKPLLAHAVPSALEAEGCRIAPGDGSSYTRIRCDGDLYYLTHFEFRPWSWHADLLKDRAEYAPLIGRVHLAYTVTGFLLLLSAFVLMWFLDRLVRTPVSRIIRAIQADREPAYRGSRELEFLSESIAGMMHSLRERSAWLERLYAVALTERGTSFFSRIAEVAGDAVGLDVLIVRRHGEESGSSEVVGSRLRSGSCSPEALLQELPLKVLHREKRSLILPGGATEQLPASGCLRSASADAYLGLPVFDREGEVIGTIHAFGSARSFGDWDTNFMRTAGQMVAAEFELLEKEQEKEAYRDQMFRSQKLESLGILAGGVAHDFNNLLMGIQGRVSLMLLDADGSRALIEPREAVEEYVRSATDLTRQLLGFARGGKYDVKPADMNEVLGHTARMFGRTKKEVRIRKEFQSGLWSVEIDRRQIEQVLLNLYVNAWHAMPAGGDLVLRTENRELDEAGAAARDLPAGRYVSVSVTDTGVGMDKATLERIFDPFFTTKGMGRGTGLGLASAYGIVENHGGGISAESTIGKGATFTILLPASEKTAARAEEGDRSPVLGRETLLLVDDEEMVRKVGKEMLKRLGYRVLVAGSGPEALSIYQEQAGGIGAVILDMIMPGMGGGETFRRLKEIDPAVRVLLCSGYSLDGQARGILDQGCKAFIQKPFDITDLSLQVRAVLDAP